MKTSALRKPVEEDAGPVAVSRKPATSEGRQQPYRRFNPVDQSFWFITYKACRGSGTAAWLGGAITTLANQRNKDGRADGWTGLLTTGELADMCGCGQGMIECDFKRFTKGDFPLFEVKPFEEAVSDGIVSPDERGRRRGTFVVRVLLESWPMAAEQFDKDRHAAEKPKRKKRAKEAQETVSLTAEPLLLMPGEKSRPVPLSSGVQARLGACAQFDPGELPIHVQLNPVIEGDTFRLQWEVLESQCSETKHQEVVSIQYADGKGSQGVDCGSSVPVETVGVNSGGPARPAKSNFNETENSQLLSFVDSIFSEVGIAKAPDRCLIDGILERLNGTPLVVFERIVRERVKQGGKFYPKLLLSLADDARYTREVRGDVLRPVDSVPGSGGKYKYVK